MKGNPDDMIVNKKYVEELTNLGLTQGEAKVYLAMIQNGPSRAGKIVEISGVSQSKVYNVLDRLILKGLANTTYKIISNTFSHWSHPGYTNTYRKKKMK